MNDLLHAATDLHRRGRLADAAVLYAELGQKHPENPTLMFLMGTLKYQLGETEEAVHLLRKAVARVPNEADWHANLGAALLARRDYNGAHRALLAARALAPAHPEALMNLSLVLKALGRIKEAAAFQLESVRSNPTDKNAHSNYLFTLSAHELLSPDETLLEYQRWDEAHGQQAALPKTDVWEPRSVLRIGYVSCDLYAHPVTRFLAPILRHHDPNRVAIFAYSDRERADSVTEQLKALTPNWRDIHHLSDRQAAERIRQDQIDILVDLGGHTAYNRLGIFAYRPAPVQATYLGYFGPTGMKAIDYWITDHELHPPDTTDASVEEIFRLPRCWVVYDSPEEAPPPNRRLLGSPLTFASYNDATKLNDDVLSTWATILLSCPDSRLRLQAKQFADGDVQSRVIETLARHGVDKTRLQFFGHDTLSAYYQSYHHVDIVLDPFPRTGGTTVADALWMGVPVVTMTGQRYASRIATSKLRAVNLGNWCAQSPEEYVNIAVKLAGSEMLRAELRAGLRTHIGSSSLCDGDGLVRALEEAYATMWARCRPQQTQSVT
jgi:protein O-GlcNAc transferase